MKEEKRKRYVQTFCIQEMKVDGWMEWKAKSEVTKWGERERKTLIQFLDDDDDEKEEMLLYMRIEHV